MGANFFSYGEFKLEYKLFGSGKDYLLAFHGTGREADDYKVFEPVLGEKYTIVAVNFFYHGNSQYPKNRLFDNQIRKNEFADLIEALLHELKVERFSLIGYSLGGRFALCITQYLHKRIDKLILIAPDGLNKRPYNEFTTKTFTGKKFVQWMISSPGAFFGVINTLNRYKLLSDKSKKLINIHFDTHEKRVLVRNTISCAKYIMPNLRKVSNNINNENIEVVLIFGKYDFVIPAKLGEHFIKFISSSKKMYIINTSHDMLTENATLLLSDILRRHLFA